MNLAAPVILAVVVIAVIALALFMGRFSQKQSVITFSPSNELEHLLMASLPDTEITEKMAKLLCSSVLLGLESKDAPDQPMSYTLTFPSECAEGMENYVVNEDGKLQFGPWVVCFSSRHVVEGSAADPLMSLLATEIGKVREYPAEQIFRAGLEEGIEVALNPFFGVRRLFSLEELRKILEMNQESA